MSDQLTRLWELGQSPWYDNLTRHHARGALDELIDAGIRGVTSNPTIFERAMGAGSDYDAQIHDLVATGTDVTELFWALVREDITDAAKRLAPLYEQSHGGDGFVSVEVDPDLADETDATIAQAKELFSTLNQPNVMIKIPGTAAGLPAIRASIGDGINVNVTLIFSLDRYVEVIDAYLSGLEDRVDRGEKIDSIASVASFFVSRVDTETDRRLPDGHDLRGRAAVANARLAYQQFERVVTSPRWERLEAAGASRQRPLWASTSTKNPAYSPTLYVDTLIGRDTVNTLAQPSIDALAGLDPSSLQPDAVRSDVDDAEATLAALADADVDFADVTDTLERDGVAAFSTSYHDALSTLAKKADQLQD